MKGIDLLMAVYVGLADAFLSLVAVGLGGLLPAAGGANGVGLAAHGGWVGAFCA